MGQTPARAAEGEAPVFTLAQTLRFYARATAIVLFSLVIIPAHMLVKLFGARDLVPPFFLHGVGRIAGLRLHTTGAAAPGALMVGNHQSWLDILGLAGAARARFVAHAGLAGHGGLKWLCDQNRTLFITRDVRGSIGEQVEQVRAALGGRPLVIFPEGTTDDGRALLPFRSSLLSAVEPLAGEVPIQPFALRYGDAHDTAWWGDEPGMQNVKRILARRGRLDLTVHFLPVLEGAALRNRKTMTAAAQDAVSAKLDLPVENA
ncbi:lysophospholipid acyltransferase family protein [Aurantiacibacter luteus]|uniref:lysophospholipid acyltransferase family protein n=1 Tax=Aurantiacibacter luteus TaxID=1581420 RepID=UPI00069B43D7|nr:lysophospholipid acyltransferase family protein [Aurantiacibacter luteus]